MDVDKLTNAEPVPLSEVEEIETSSFLVLPGWIFILK